VLIINETDGDFIVVRVITNARARRVQI